MERGFHLAQCFTPGPGGGHGQRLGDAEGRVEEVTFAAAQSTVQVEGEGIVAPHQFAQFRCAHGRGRPVLVRTQCVHCRRSWKSRVRKRSRGRRRRCGRNGRRWFCAASGNGRQYDDCRNCSPNPTQSTEPGQRCLPKVTYSVTSHCRDHQRALNLRVCVHPDCRLMRRCPKMVVMAQVADSWDALPRFGTMPGPHFDQPGGGPTRRTPSTSGRR